MSKKSVSNFDPLNIRRVVLVSILSRTGTNSLLCVDVLLLVMYPTNETLEREISYLLSNQSLSASPDIDPVTIVSVDAGRVKLKGTGSSTTNCHSKRFSYYC